MNTTPAQFTHPQPGANNQIVDHLWQIYSQNLNSGATSFIEMPINLKSVLTENGLEIIAVRFRNLIQAPVLVFEDPVHGVIQIMPAHHESGHNEIIPGARDPKVKVSSKAKVARPPNAFILYRQHHHPLLKSQNPDLHNNEISVILGAQWKKESDSIKARFITMAKQLKAKHQLEHPNYQYQPRKPSEKKRRLTQRKKAALAETSRAKPNLSVNSASVELDPGFSVNDFSAPVLKLPETLAGNAMIELGDEEVDEQVLSNMLYDYNNSNPQQANQLANIITHSSPPVIYGERTEEGQAQSNFYSNFENFSSNEYLSTDMAAVMEGKEDFTEMYNAMASYAQQVDFDTNNAGLFDAELNRICHWDEEALGQQSS